MEPTDTNLKPAAFMPSWRNRKAGQVLTVQGRPAPALPPDQPPQPAKEHWAGDCPECRQPVQAWRECGALRSHGHEPGCRFQGAPVERLLLAWKVPLRTERPPTNPSGP